MAEPEGKRDRRNENKNMSGGRERKQGKSRPSITEKPKRATKKSRGKRSPGS